MYTQCPDCSTVFRVTAEALRSAHGRVRCGICSSAFNALDYLNEQPVARPDGEDRVEDTITVEELPGTEFIELSTATHPAQPDGASGPDDDDDSPATVTGPADVEADLQDADLEFHGKAGDLERLFVPAVFPGAAARAAVEKDEATGPISDEQVEKALETIAEGDFSGIEVEESDLDRTDEHPILVLDAAEQETGEAEETPLGVLIPEELRRDLAPPEDTAADTDPPFSPAAGPRRWPYAAAAVLLALLLAAQLGYQYRDSLVRHQGIGPWVLRGFGALGLKVAAPIDLAAFELRQLGAASEPGQSGRLKLRASIVNRAAFAQPYPLLRLTLQDRFGSTIGARDLEPREYLPGGSGNARLLGPSQRADAEVVLVDPGRDAVGFELDVCSRDATGLHCSEDSPQDQR